MRVAHLLSTFCCVGYFPYMPGTIASAITAVLCYFLMPTTIGLQITFLAILLPAALWSSHAFARQLGHCDPSCIVIDEVVGMYVALLLVPHLWWVYLLAFGLFRVLDITKPFAIAWLERLPGGLGIVMDDLAAGVAAGVIIRLLISVFG